MEKAKSLLRTTSILALLCVGGCISFYRYHPVKVLVRDAETMAPVPSAEVKVTYLYMLLLNPPTPASAVTDDHGVATVRTATYRGQGWSASANGFLKGGLSIWYDALPTEIRLYRKPRPQVTAVIPNDYRGLLKIDLRPVESWIQDHVGQRQFTFVATSNGDLRIDASPLLLGFDAFDLAVNHANGDGVPMRRGQLDSSDIAVRFVSARRYQTLYVVGTEADEQTARSAIEDRFPDGHTSTNDKAWNALFGK